MQKKAALDRRHIAPKELSRERVAILIETAEAAFLEKGFSGCSIDHIAKVSGVSKSTIYRHFADKEALYEAVSERIADDQAKQVAAFQLDADRPAASLRAFAKHIYRVDTTPRFLEFFRSLIAEAGRFPAMSDRLRTTATAKVLSELAEYFAQLIAGGRMVHPDALQAAITFYVLARGNFRPLLGRSSDADAELRRMQADIEIFLKGCEIR